VPPDESNSAPYRVLPEFCRVAITLRPSNDSDIKMEVWLPTADWNGKYLAVGNAAFTGSVRYPSLIAPLSLGYATSSTDTGHEGNTAGPARSPAVTMAPTCRPKGTSPATPVRRRSIRG
jgi:hypothetical protein